MGARKVDGLRSFGVRRLPLQADPVSLDRPLIAVPRMNAQDRGRIAVVAVAVVTVITALCVRVVLSDGPEFVAGVLVGIPLGAMLGWVADQAIPLVVDRYMAAIRRGE